MIASFRKCLALSKLNNANSAHAAASNRTLRRHVEVGKDKGSEAHPTTFFCNVWVN